MPFKLIPILLLLGAALPLQADIDGRNNGAEASKQDRTAPSSGKLDFQTDLFTGRFSYGVPIQVAPARHGTEPQLGLRYNSSAGNGWCGVGWELEIGHIQRETKYGVPVRWTNSFPVKEYDSSKGFTFSLGGNGCPLVAVGANDYRAETETAFLRFALITNSGGSLANYWQVTDKSGNNYFFGLTPNSRMANSKTGWPSNEARGTFRWALSRIETVNGDVTTVTYTNFGGMIYPTLLAYNGHTNSLSPTHTVGFQLEDRPDGRLAYNSGYRVQTSKRLASVINQVGGRLVRRYQLNYTNSASTLKSLLRSVTVFGTNDSSSLPPTTFSYTAQSFEFLPATTWTNVMLHPDAGRNSTEYGKPFNSDPNGLFADLVDVDGDSRPDRVVTATNAGSPWTCLVVQRNTGYGFGAASQWTPMPSGGQSGDPHWTKINSMYTRFLDINGDGIPDRVLDPPAAYTNTSPNSFYTSFLVELNQGTGFASEMNWSNVVPNNSGATGTIPNFLAIENGGYVKMVDMNGDGLPDRVMRGWQADDSLTIHFTNLWIQFNTGSGFTSTNWFGPYYSQAQWTQAADGLSWTAVEGTHVRLLDINGDGLPDRVMVPYSTNLGGTAYGPEFTNLVVEFNNGSGFEPGEGWPGLNTMTNAGLSCNVEDTPLYRQVADTDFVALRDINGDGLPDRILRRYCSVTNWFVQINTGIGFGPTNMFGPVHGQSGDDAYASIENSVGRLMDINGDGLPDRVVAKYNGQTTDNYFVVELNKGPFPDLLSVVSNGIGGSVAISYVPASRWDNRENTNSASARSLLPYPVYTVASVAVSDGLYPSNTNSFAYDGGMWSASRREFNGFASAKVTDPLGGTTTEWFHQAGGRDNSALGEYQDSTNSFAKRGFPFRVETRGTNGQLYKLVLNKVEETVLSGGRRFPYISQTLAVDYPGNTSSNRAVCQQFAYDTNTGNLLLTLDLGEVTLVTAANHTFQDMGSDTVCRLATYAPLANTNILDKPQWTALATDASATQVLRESLYSYDGGTGSLTQQRDRICESSYRTNSFGYDLYGNQTSHTSPVGIVTSFGFDTVYHALPVLQTVAGSFATTFSHDPLSGQLVISVDPKGLVVSNSLDVFLRLTGTYVSSTSNGPPNVWQTLRDYGLGGISAGVSKNYLRVRANDGVDGNNGLETWTYLDGQDRAIQQRMESESNGYRVTDTSYEKRGLVRFVTLPYFSGGTVANTNYAAPTGNKAGTSMEYDPLGRRTKVAPGQTGNFNSGVLTNVTIGSGDTGSPLGPSLTDYQDGNDPWSLVVTDPENKVRKYRRDAYGRTNQILEVTGSGTYTSTLKWDKTGVLTNLTDHAQNVIEYAYNDLGEVVAMADPDLGVWQYRRDFAGRLREQVDAKGNLTSLIYNDPIGRLSHKLVYDPNGVLVLGVTNIFDTGEPGYTVYPGQTFAKFDNEGWEKHSYDVRGRELKSTRYLAATAASYTIERSFDDGDHVRSLSYPSSLLTLTNGYDSGGHLSDVTRCDGVTNTHYLHFRGFTELNQPVGADFGNGVTTTNDYWPVSRRLRSLTTYIGGRHLQALSYQYNRSDDVISISDGAYSGTGSGALSATYDDLHRLSSVARATNTASFSYSAIGNVLGNGEWAGAGYDYGSRLPHAVKRVGSQYYAYDMNGNTVARGPQNLAYDAANRLVLVRRNGAALASFGYAADGARLWKQGVTNLQVWIGNVYEEKQGKRLCHIWAGDRRVATFDSAGTLLSGTNNTTLYYSHGDHLGSSSVLTDHAGNRAEHFEYSAFGRERYDDPANAFPISQRFTGQVLDDETGLYYYGARYYDPAAARFAQPDTVIPDIANPQSWNRYSYCINNPLGRTDPSGHWDWPAPAYNWMPNSWVRYLGGGGSGPATPAAPEALSNLGMLQSDLGGYDGSGVRTFTTMAKVGVGLTPAGVYNSGYTLGTGKDAYDSEVTVSRGERLQAGAETAAAILPFVAKVGTSLRAAGTAAEDTGTFSRLAQPGGLMVSEKAGGHLLARHVGLSEADLAARLSSQRGITAASSFTTRAEAEAAVAGAFDANAVAVSAWTSSGANGRFVLNAPFSGGLVLQRGAAAASPGTGVRVVLQGNGSGGYHTLTGFPTP